MVSSKIQNNIVFIFIFTWAFFQINCSDTILYSPSNLPNNLTSKAGQVYVQGGAGSNGVNITAGFSPGDHVQLAFSFSNDKVDEDKEKASMQTREYMIGYYNKFDNDAVFEAFFGAGTGTSVSTAYPDGLFTSAYDTLRHTGDFNKLFVQVNYGFSRPGISTGFALRCSQLNYSGVVKTRNGKDLMVNSAPKGVLWEPMGFAKMGGENIQFTVMAGMPYIPGVVDIGYEQIFFGVAMSVNFSAF